jgi:serine/threonine-protein kinase HipA
MNCLLCYKPLAKNEIDYHENCVVKFFGLTQVPVIDIDEKKMQFYARQVVDARTAIAGVQPKLSLWLEKSKKQIRFTVIDNKSNYIFKPQSETYKALPENEDLCMHLARVFGIQAAAHGLVRNAGKNLAYLTQRFDRAGEVKLACEDLCQLSETLTEHKYRGSYEKTGKVIRNFSSQPGLDALHYFELVVFSFVTGNADMHLKNFSMLEAEPGYFALSPAYDLVSTMLVIKNEEEQMSLTINGKKNKIGKKDFDAMAAALSITEKQKQNFYHLLAERMEEAAWWIKHSFLPATHKDKLHEILSGRVRLLTR